MIALISRSLRVILVILLTGMTLTVALQIVLRYVFQSPLLWGGEITRYMFIYLIFLGAASGIHHGIHVSIDALVIRLPARAQKVMTMIAKSIVAAFLLFLLLYGLQLAISTMGQHSPALGIPIGYAYLAIPIGAFFSLMFVFAPKEEQPVDEVLA